MNSYFPTEQASINDLIKKSFQLCKKIYISLLPFTIILIIISVLTTFFIHEHLITLRDYRLKFHWILFLYLFATSFWISYQISISGSYKIFQSLQLCLKKLWRILAVQYIINTLAFYVPPLITGFIAGIEEAWFGYYHHTKAFFGLIFFLIDSSSCLIILSFFWLYLPGILFDNELLGIEKSFCITAANWRKSILMVAVAFFPIILVKIIEAVTTIITNSYEINNIFHIFDQINIIIFLPWLYSVLINTYNDLKLSKKLIK